MTHEWRCGNCLYFNVPYGEPQWRNLGKRVGECGQQASDVVRPEHGGMVGVREDPKRKNWIIKGGSVLVDIEFGCVRFVAGTSASRDMTLATDGVSYVDRGYRL